MNYRGRIAPSPTGYLHLGHARTFWIAYRRAVEATGTLVLRNDNLDQQRCRPQFVDAMLRDLEWLGIRWQEGLMWPDGNEQGDLGPYAQSQRNHLYQSAWQQLKDAHAIYPCQCSRRDLQAVSAPHADEDDEPLYPGTCRPRTDSPKDPIEGDCAWRFQVPDGEVVEFHDLHCGPQRFVAGKDFGDFLVMRRDGVPSYQLACVVDDASMKMTEVVRGRDLLKSSARQILLQRALRLPTPAYLHCDLVVDDAGARLAKRHNALSLHTLREQGIQAEEIVDKFKL